MDDTDSSRRPSQPTSHNATSLRAAALQSESALQSEIDVSFVSDAEIAELNTLYRRKPRPTDVLSFSQTEGEELPFDLPTNPLPLGDLVISIETAARQAAERHHSLATEVAFLAVHGTLHLLGYDHVTSSQRRAMWKQQEAIVQRLQTSAAGAEQLVQN
ncbi:MAG TPA: rRNA maturation RNase YbeY [Abditibacteriaceae bacterium]|jgi:probable rRNA maturation factor